MAVFPAVPRVSKVDLFVNGGWVDVTPDVYNRDGITISRGRRDEQSSPEPSRCLLTLNNRSGNYSPRNPVGAYFGSLGRNTPLRVAVQTGSDTFARTVANGWGTADTGHVYTTSGLGGTVAASDFAVSGGFGTQSVPVAAAHRIAYLPAASYRNIDVGVTVSLPFTSVTGGPVEPANVVLRGQSTTDYYMARVSVATSGAITLGIVHYDGTVVAAAVATGLTHSSAQALRVRFHSEGQTLRAKIWAVASPEPFGWLVTGRLSTDPLTGWVGIRSGVATGNTNTKPIVFSYDDLTIRVPRFFGEVSNWPQRWDITGTDVYVQVEASGLRRRLGQGTGPLLSTLRRAYTNELASDVVAYWPCEDGTTTTTIASGLPGAPDMSLSGKTTFASDTSLAGSAPLPVMDVGSWRGGVANYTVTGQTALRFYIHTPSTPLTDGTPLFWLVTTGTAAIWIIGTSTLTPPGSILINAGDSSGFGIMSAGPFAFGLIDTHTLLGLDLTQNGANVDWAIESLDVGQTSGKFASGTLTGRTVGQVVTFVADPLQICKGVTMGHIAIRKAVTQIYDTAPALNARTGDPLVSGETTGARIVRLCAQQGITVSGDGDRTTTAAAGAQRPESLLTLLDEAADADLGTLYEPRGDFGLAFRTRTSLYSQDPTLSLDYTAGQVAPPLEPVDDDQLTRNDVTAIRRDGSSAEAQLLTGRMSVTDPSAGGAGRYSTQETFVVAFDDQLPDLAFWRMTMGTPDEPRYPTIKVNLASPQVVAAGLEAAALTVDVDDRITITNPKTGQTPDTISQIVRGYSETIRAFEHTISFNCAPESPYALLQLDTVGKRKIDSDTSTLTSGVTSSATSLSVTSVGQTWTRAAGDMPIPIRVAGEVMNVTAVTGATSPQTFTVVRSVNGIVKAQSAGAVVSLARPAKMGL